MSVIELFSFRLGIRNMEINVHNIILILKLYIYIYITLCRCEKNISLQIFLSSAAKHHNNALCNIFHSYRRCTAHAMEFVNMPRSSVACVNNNDMNVDVE